MAFTQAGLFRSIPNLSRQTPWHRWRQPASVTMRVLCASNSLDSRVLRQSSLEKVERILQHRFNDRSLLAQALTHRSIINSSASEPAYYVDRDSRLRKISGNNERLELLGDHVFGLLATQVLYEREDEKSEGELTKTLQFILSRRTADKYFRSLGLDKYMLEATSLKGRQGSRYGDCFEALLAALFLDGGFDRARIFFQSRVVPNCDIFAGEFTDTNYKRKLQEYLVGHGLPTPALATQVKYGAVTTERTGDRFAQSITLFGRRVAIGTGSTRLAADQDAARRLLLNLQNSKTTCFLIRLARRANDQISLEKLQSVRAVQVAANSDEVTCPS